jgi:hypothetical protein
METYRKKRIEVIAEAAIVARLLATIDEAGASGYTTQPMSGGRGHHGSWSDLGITPGASMVMVLVIASDELAGRLVPMLHAVLGDFNGVILLSDVAVIRGGHFA